MNSFNKIALAIAAALVGTVLVATNANSSDNKVDGEKYGPTSVDTETVLSGFDTGTVLSK